MPLATYSRDEIAVVNGATGTCISSLAPRANLQPSGVLTVAGSPEGIRPSDGDSAAAAGLASGSAPDAGAKATDMRRQTARTAARRTTTAIGLTGDTVRIVGLRLRSLLVVPANLL